MCAVVVIQAQNKVMDRAEGFVVGIETLSLVFYQLIIDHRHLGQLSIYDLHIPRARPSQVMKDVVH